MGMEISAKLIYGLTYGEFEDKDKINELIDDDDLEYASPYYYADRDEWIVGVRVGYKEFQNENEMLMNIKKAKDKFFTLTDQDGRFFVTQHVY